MYNFHIKNLKLGSRQTFCLMSMNLLVILELNEATFYFQKKQTYQLKDLSIKYLYVSNAVISAVSIVSKGLSEVISCHGLV